MRKSFRNRIVGAALVAFALVAAACGSGDDPTITVGSTNFGEQLIVGEIYASVLEAEGFDVDRKFNLGNREVVNPALKSGEIDLLVEYTGTLLTFEGGTSSTDSQQTWNDLNSVLDGVGLVAYDYAPAQDKNGFVVTAATADRLGVSKVSDLAAYNGELVLGASAECPNRPFCLIGLQEVYGLQFSEFKPLDVGGPLTVAALEGGEIDVGLLFTSDGIIAAKGFVLLEDDRNLQPAENIVPVVNQETADAYGDRLAEVLNEVSAKLSTDELQELNRRYSENADDPTALAQEWLSANGF